MTFRPYSPHWRKPRRSQNTTNCVEVAHIAGGTAVRDTKDRDSDHVGTTTRQWSTFIAAVKDGRFDRRRARLDLCRESRPGPDNDPPSDRATIHRTPDTGMNHSPWVRVPGTWANRARWGCG